MDLQYLAGEYKKLQQKIYMFGLENGDAILFEFSNNDFYHLLGFKKFTDATIVRMIEDGTYYKDKFYKNVLKGEITFHNTKITLKRASNYLADGKFVNFCDAEETENVKRVLNFRFPYFSYENVMELLNSELVVLYDKEKGLPWNKVEADRIFFKLMTQEDRNLHFFIKKKELSNENCPVSFFLEEQKDSYIKTNSRCKEKEQEKAEICYRIVKDKQNNSYDEFTIFWNKIRFVYSRKVNATLFKAQIKLQEYFGKDVVKSIEVIAWLDKLALDIADLVNRINHLEEILKLIEAYEIAASDDEKITIATDLDEKYNIDIMFEQDIKKRLLNEAKPYKESLSKKKKEVKKLEKYLPEIIELEKLEIIYAFEKVVPGIRLLSDENFREMIEGDGILNSQDGKKILPKLFRMVKLVGK